MAKKSQVCGVMAGPRVDEVPDNVFRVSSRINSTWGGSLVDMVRCEIILETMREERVVENAASVGAHLQEMLLEVQGEFPSLVANVRGLGLMCAFDLPSEPQRDAAKQRAFEQGMLLLTCGDRSLRMRSALNLSRAEVLEAGQRLRAALREM